jgi:hypothetical protein
MKTLAKSWCIALPLALTRAAAPARGQAGEDWTGLGRAVTLEISTRQFDAGAGLGSPADYQRPAHVAAPVIDDIARWIASR